MEIIFDHKPTAEELAELGPDYSNYSKEAYLADLKRRADHFKSDVEYEALVDLQELFNSREDLDASKKYGDIIDTKFKDITDRIFNE